MAKALAESYIAVYKRIKLSGSIWVQGMNGLWSHSFNKRKVATRLLELHNLIEHNMRMVKDRSMFIFDPVIK